MSDNRIILCIVALVVLSSVPFGNQTWRADCFLPFSSNKINQIILMGVVFFLPYIFHHSVCNYVLIRRCQFSLNMSHCHLCYLTYSNENMGHYLSINHALLIFFYLDFIYLRFTTSSKQYMCNICIIYIYIYFQ